MEPENASQQEFNAKVLDSMVSEYKYGNGREGLFYRELGMGKEYVPKYGSVSILSVTEAEPDFVDMVELDPSEPNQLIHTYVPTGHSAYASIGYQDVDTTISWTSNGEIAQRDVESMAVYYRLRPKYTYAEGELERATSLGLLCEICRQPYQDPVLHCNCNRVFCNTCLISPCPACKAPVSDETLGLQSLASENDLNNLKVHCSFCQRIFKRKELEQHLEASDGW